jgi:hypothetical protein
MFSSQCWSLLLWVMQKLGKTQNYNWKHTYIHTHTHTHTHTYIYIYIYIYIYRHTDSSNTHFVLKQLFTVSLLWPWCHWCLFTKSLNTTAIFFFYSLNCAWQYETHCFTTHERCLLLLNADWWIQLFQHSYISTYYIPETLCRISANHSLFHS